jgi:succinyl-CoA synthetase beta subunit
MKLYEFQAKSVFQEFGIVTPKSKLVSKDQIDISLDDIGYPCVIKAQVLSGGRGKRGLIALVKDEKSARSEMKRIFDAEPSMKYVLIEEAISISQEIYISITVDAPSGQAVILASESGGVEIETLAVEHPEKIIKEHIDLRYGLLPHQARHMAYQMHLSAQTTKEMIQIIMKLYDIFIKYDAELVEINPLFLTKSDQLVAGDGKIMIDDNSLFRQTRFAQTEADYSSEAAYEASLEGIPFIQFDGDIGLMCAGAGLTTTVYDLIHYEGGTVANYLEFGGPNYKKAVKAMEICLKVPSKVILIVTFGTIARADVMAQGIVDAIEKLNPDRPIVTCIRGTNEIEAVNILKRAGLTPLFDTEEAVKMACELAKGGKL